MRTDRQTDLTKLTVTFCNFANAPKNTIDMHIHRGELSYLAPLGSENISTPYFKQCFFQGGGITPQTE